jgi:flavin reductase (DIM6/NTAB) family NADH-FMN oxidoreductase RutF
MILKSQDLSVKENYKLIIGSVLPRPIAFVSTLSADGVSNLAPFSFFTGVSSNPPTICFVSSRKGTEAVKKDTLSNIEYSGEFVVNVVTEDIVEPMNETATEFPPDIDEFEVAGLTPLKAQLVKPYLVKESPINMECRLYKTIDIGDGSPGSATIIVGEIILYHIADHLLNEGRIDTALLKPVGRLAGMDYTTLGRRFTLERKTIR